MICLIFSVDGIQQFLEKPQDKDVIKGQTVELRCVVENKAGQIQWAKDGLMLGMYLFNPKIFPTYTQFEESAADIWKTLWQMENLLIMNNFSVCHNVFQMVSKSSAASLLYVGKG